MRVWALLNVWVLVSTEGSITLELAAVVLALGLGLGLASTLAGFLDTNRSYADEHEVTPALTSGRGV